MKKILFILIILSCSRTDIACKAYEVLTKEAAQRIAVIVQCKNTEEIAKSIRRYLKDSVNCNSMYKGFICSELAYRVTKNFQLSIPSSWECSAKVVSKKMFNSIKKVCNAK